MKKNAINTAMLGAIAAASLTLFGASAQADTRVSIHTPHVAVSFGEHEVHFRGDVDHHRHVKYEEPKHICRYVQRPVDRHYIDECGRIVHYTEYITVRVCESYHQPRPVRVRYDRDDHHYRDRDDHRYTERRRDDRHYAQDQRGRKYDRHDDREHRSGRDDSRHKD